MGFGQSDQLKWLARPKQMIYEILPAFGRFCHNTSVWTVLNTATEVLRPKPIKTPVHRTGNSSRTCAQDIETLSSPFAEVHCDLASRETVV